MYVNISGRKSFCGNVEQADKLRACYKFRQLAWVMHVFTKISAKAGQYYYT